MAKVITDNQHYADIAAAIRTKNETETLYKPSEMATAILAIQGGVELNFKVVGGKTQPSNPVENTIWVNTETDITGWGFGVEADKPATPDPGMVWFVTFEGSPIKFNALKEDFIIVNLISAYQYISGTWEDIDEVKIYQNGGWVDFLLFVVLKNGEYVDTYFDVSAYGGVTDNGNRADGSGREFYAPYVMYGALILRTKDKIPKMVNRLQITARLESDGGFGGDAYNQFFMSPKGGWPASFDASNKFAVTSPFTAASTTNKTFNLDLSGITEDMYLWAAFSMKKNGANIKLVIKDILGW